MEVSDVRKRLLETIARARRAAADRRARIDEAAREYDVFLEQVATPIVRQAANVLRAEGYTFNVFTPSGSVRLMSERSAEDFVEIVLDTSGASPQVVGRVSRSRGHRVLETERPLGSGPVRDLTETDVLAFLADALEPFVER